ncbi:MAG: phosphoribosylformylglycinamidine synthase subunit PurQ [Bacteroidia bacterium]|nr:phosphoribosylformylglycinamidine synthase subunit PurQ [Bacteroidia bacterium]
MKLAVVTFPGSNCDIDLIEALEQVSGKKVLRVWHKDTSLPALDYVFLPGGFSYGDYLRSGAIASTSPIMAAIKEFAKKGGKVVGICNGFQILTEARLLPGALLPNISMHFCCKHIYIKSSGDAFSNLPSHPLRIPIAHSEGNYYCPDNILKSMQDRNQIVFQYCTAEGLIIPEANPNGSLHNIAGICNATYNVLGMMPHPERAANPKMGNTDGTIILEAILGKLS